MKPSLNVAAASTPVLWGSVAAAGASGTILRQASSPRVCQAKPIYAYRSRSLPQFP
jgi:hypothetical protein